jgi:predicted O-linked N-acetylglucosamine transferase (SPINDLY family)
VTRSLQEYERVALELAFDPGRLSAIRHQLQQCRSTHAYFDTTRYVRHLESAYRSMWERCAAGLAPAPIEVSAIPRDRAPP